MFKKLNEAATPKEMRAAIEEVIHHHPIVRNVLLMARRDGLSSEDTYSAVAYYALQMLVQTQTDYARVLSTMPMPPMFLMEKPAA